MVQEEPRQSADPGVPQDSGRTRRYKPGATKQPKVKLGQ